MRVLHIIPMAFNYFSDIAQAAFRLVEGLDEAGVTVDVITLQYNQPTREQKTKFVEAAPSREYVAEQPIAQVVEKVKEEDFQLVHLHCPFFGGGRDWLRFKKDNPEFPLVVTYHHDFVLTDLFSVYVKMYNHYYIPKFFVVADVVTCFDWELFSRSAGGRHLDSKEKLISLISSQKNTAGEFIHLTERQNTVQLLGDRQNLESAVGILLEIYQKLANGYKLV